LRWQQFSVHVASSSRSSITVFDLPVAAPRLEGVARRTAS
jgi:hypothetical protein